MLEADLGREAEILVVIFHAQACCTVQYEEVFVYKVWRIIPF